MLATFEIRISHIELDDQVERQTEYILVATPSVGMLSLAQTT